MRNEKASNLIYCAIFPPIFLPSLLSLLFFPPGRSASTSGVTGPFRAFPKSLSVDFGGLSHPQGPPLSQQPSAPAGSSNAQDRYAALSQLDGVFSDAGGKRFTVCVCVCEKPQAFCILLPVSSRQQGHKLSLRHAAVSSG